MDRWEYLTEFVQASTSNVGWQRTLGSMEERVPIYSPQTMMPHLNERGIEGWELVHMEPVEVGTNLDVRVHRETSSWTSKYFCVFKRRLNR